ncbi:hypothetical protein [Massilia varians]|uniref:hypothetical protein n=1 Tax=Massilia varians TaxID=457921 RepID=UPI0025523ECC|nr:hypothetical protein [Massilia varians]MDK6077567.1 hypothetical protein [Massilia varians]
MSCNSCFTSAWKPRVSFSATAILFLVGGSNKGLKTNGLLQYRDTNINFKAPAIAAMLQLF